MDVRASESVGQIAGSGLWGEGDISVRVVCRGLSVSIAGGEALFRRAEGIPRGPGGSCLLSASESFGGHSAI